MRSNREKRNTRHDNDSYYISGSLNEVTQHDKTHKIHAEGYFFLGVAKRHRHADWWHQAKYKTHKINAPVGAPVGTPVDTAVRTHVNLLWVLL